MIDLGPQFCNCCEAPLKDDRIVWLEYDNATDLYHRPGEVPEGHESLGNYPFGPTCAKKALKEGRA